MALSCFQEKSVILHNQMLHSAQFKQAGQKLSGCFKKNEYYKKNIRRRNEKNDYISFHNYDYIVFND